MQRASDPMGTLRLRSLGGCSAQGDRGVSLGARESDDRVEESPKGEKRVAGLNHPHRERATQTPDDTLAPPARQLLALVDPALHVIGEATALSLIGHCAWLVLLALRCSHRGHHLV